MDGRDRSNGGVRHVGGVTSPEAGNGVVGLHMYTRASSGKLAKLGVASSCLLDVPRWDFNWQGIYELEEPVPISPTLYQIYLECHFDNTGNDNAAAPTIGPCVGSPLPWPSGATPPEGDRA